MISNRIIVLILRAILFFVIAFYLTKGINYQLKCNEFERRFERISAVKPEERIEEYLSTRGKELSHPFFKDLRIGYINSFCQKEIFELSNLISDILIYQEVIDSDRFSFLELCSIVQRFPANSGDRLNDLANKAIDLGWQYQSRIEIISD